MARSFYSHIREAWESPKEGKLADLQWQRQQDWRRQGAIERIERPTRLDRARSLGYKAKQGVVVTRAAVRKGGARIQRHKAGRRSKRQGVTKITRRKSIQRIAEHPAMQSDDDLGWICDDSHRGRAFRGKSSAGQRGRGLQHRGKGTEHTRPSQRSNLRKGN